MHTIYTTEWSKPQNWWGMWTSYRIEVKETEHGWFQRHIWKRTDGTEDVEAWIPTFDHRGRLGYFKPVTEWLTCAVHWKHGRKGAAS